MPLTAPSLLKIVRSP